MRKKRDGPYCSGNKLNIHLTRQKQITHTIYMYIHKEIADHKDLEMYRHLNLDLYFMLPLYITRRLKG